MKSIKSGSGFPGPDPMPPRGFCQHGKVWTTCPICGKDVIAAASKRTGKGAEFVEVERSRKPKRTEAEEAPEERPAEDEPAEGES